MKKIVILCLCFVVFSCDKKQNPPNVIIIYTDDQGYQDVGCFGSPNIKTPHLDKMAKQGARLTNFYAAQAVCSASRAALLTGCYPNRIGIHNALRPNSKKGLNPKETTIAEMLKKRGYRTALFGKWHLGDHAQFMPTRHGFDSYFGILYSNDMWPHHPQQKEIFNFQPLYLYENEKPVEALTDQSLLTTQITQKSVAFIDKNAKNPFFLYVAHPQPHVPLFVSDKFKNKSQRGLYGDMIMEIDWSVGQILKALKKNKIENNTMVIFTSDNGPWLAYGTHAGSAKPLREGKGTAWEGGHREPCIIYYPDKIKAGTEIHTPIMNIDILPTIAAVTHAELPKLKIDGKNVLSILMGESEQSPHQAYYFYYRVNELQALRYKNWKMYFPHTYRTLNGREGGKNGNPVPYEHNQLKGIELYDLSNDVSETHNVADKHPKIVAKIKLLAQKMRNELGDSLYKIKGKENRPAGRVGE